MTFLPPSGPKMHSLDYGTYLVTGGLGSDDGESKGWHLQLPRMADVLTFIFQLNTKTSPATKQAPGPEEKGESAWARRFVEQVSDTWT